MNRLLKYLIEILIMFGLYVVCDNPGTKKYIVIAFLMLVFLIAGRKKKWNAEVFLIVSIPVAVYFLLGFFWTFLNASAYVDTVKIIIFWLIPLIFAFSMYIFYGEKMTHIVDVQFLGSCLAYLIPKGRFILETITVESMFAYVYGAFFIYYAYKKRWEFCAVAAALMFLTDKRIVVLAVAMTVSIQGFLWLFRDDKRLVFGIWGIVTAIINIYLWMIYSGTLQAMMEGIGINTNGRTKMYGKVTEWFGGDFLMAGKGLGIVEELLAAWRVKDFANLHNDLLKFHIELGFVGLLLLLTSYGVAFYLVEKKYSASKMKMFLSMAIYTMILFATDNVSIYVIYLIPVYSIYFAVLSENREKNVSIEKC